MRALLYQAGTRSALVYVDGWRRQNHAFKKRGILQAECGSYGSPHRVPKQEQWDICVLGLGHPQIDSQVPHEDFKIKHIQAGAAAEPVADMVVRYHLDAVLAQQLRHLGVTPTVFAGW